MTQNGKLELLTPDNCAIAMIDYQPQMFFGVQSHDRAIVTNNILGLAKSAKAFSIPTILSTVETKSFSGNMIPTLLDVFPEQKLVERTSMNSWEDKGFRDAVKATGRKKLIITGLWTEVCVTFPSLEAIRDGYEVYFVTDVCGSTTMEAHEMSIQRCIQGGAVPMTWIQTLLEWQRDWARKDTYDATTSILREHAGAYGHGIEYAATMVHDQAPGRKSSRT